MLTAEQVKQVTASAEYDRALRQALYGAGVSVVVARVDVRDLLGLPEDDVIEGTAIRIVEAFERDLNADRPERVSTRLTSMERKTLRQFVAWMMKEQRRDDIAGSPELKKLLALTAG
jgi:hypothetical protein